jgi:hypothetical protein
MVISEEDQEFLDKENYELYFIGFDNQNAYRKYYEGFYFELVCRPNIGRWTYHVERSNRMLFDSGISNTSFDKAETAHNIMILKITDFSYKKRGY